MWIHPYTCLCSGVFIAGVLVAAAVAFGVIAVSVIDVVAIFEMSFSVDIYIDMYCIV